MCCTQVTRRPEKSHSHHCIFHFAIEIISSRANCNGHYSEEKSHPHEQLEQSCLAYCPSPSATTNMSSFQLDCERQLGCNTLQNSTAVFLNYSFTLYLRAQKSVRKILYHEQLGNPKAQEVKKKKQRFPLSDKFHTKQNPVITNQIPKHKLFVINLYFHKGFYFL